MTDREILLSIAKLSDQERVHQDNLRILIKPAITASGNIGDLSFQDHLLDIYTDASIRSLVSRGIRDRALNGEREMRWGGV